MSTQHLSHTCQTQKKAFRSSSRFVATICFFRSSSSAVHGATWMDSDRGSRRVDADHPWPPSTGSQVASSRSSPPRLFEAQPVSRLVYGSITARREVHEHPRVEGWPSRSSPQSEGGGAVRGPHSFGLGFEESQGKKVRGVPLRRIGWQKRVHESPGSKWRCSCWARTPLMQHHSRLRWNRHAVKPGSAQLANVPIRVCSSSSG